ncbi:type 1 fimbrial protein [Escherichia coli]|nr:type 1 fimbrial protein [Escherichia coli]
MKYNNIIFLGLCLGLTTYSALSADSVIKISGRVLDYGCTVSSDSLNNPRNFTWNIISNNSVVMPTGGCTVDSRNVTVDLPDFPGSAEIPLGVYCSSEQKLSFYLSGATTDSARQVFANTAPDATKASGVGVSLMRNGKILATGENVSLGTVNKSKVPLGLSATYGQTGNKVSAGTVQSVIGVTFIYE